MHSINRPIGGEHEECPYRPGWGGGMFVVHPLPCTLKALGGSLIHSLGLICRPACSDMKSGCIPNNQ